MIQGSAYHDTVATDLTNKRDKKELLPAADLADIFSTSFDKQVHNKTSDDEGDKWEFDEIDWGDEESGEVKDKGIELVNLYHNTIAIGIDPIDIESKLTLEVDSIKFVLITDVITEDTIIDHKVKKRRFSEDDLKRDLQATAYTFFHRKPFEFHQALKLKTPVIDIAKTVRGASDWRFFEYLVPKVWQAIQAGVYYPSPNGWHCSEDFCGYWSLCRGGKNV